MVITDSSLRQGVYETIYNLIKNITFVDVSKAVTVTAAYVDNPDDLLPQVVINPVDVDQDKFGFGMGGSDKTIRVVIDIYTRKSKDRDVIADQIMNTINNYSFEGLMLVDTSESVAVNLVDDNAKVRLKSISLTFIRR